MTATSYLVDRGVVPQRQARSGHARGRARSQGETHVAGVWRAPDAPGLFTPHARPCASHLVRARRPGHRRGGSCEPGRAGGDRGRRHAQSRRLAQGRPDGGDLPNNHLSYAITWFGLAVGLLGVCLAYHISKGRLAW